MRVWGLILSIFTFLFSVATEAHNIVDAHNCAEDMRQLVEYKSQPEVGAAVVVIIVKQKKKKVLMIKRKSGYWGFVGGKYEAEDKSIADCARREIQEEIGVTLKNLRFVRLHRAFVEEYKKSFINAILVAEIESGIPERRERQKNKKMGWYPWNQLPQPLFGPNKELIKQGLNPFQVDSTR